MDCCCHWQWQLLIRFSWVIVAVAKKLASETELTILLVYVAIAIGMCCNSTASMPACLADMPDYFTRLCIEGSWSVAVVGISNVAVRMMPGAPVVLVVYAAEIAGQC
jgi:hypothetical protein